METKPNLTHQEETHGKQSNLHVETVPPNKFGQVTVILGLLLVFRVVIYFSVKRIAEEATIPFCTEETEW